MVIDKDNIKILLIILMVGLGLGYAYINSDLNINGTAQINSANWDVHWANIQVREGSVSGSNVVSSPTIDSSGTTIDFSVILSKPGDYYSCTLDAVNAGTMDAVIESVDYKLNGVSVFESGLPGYLDIVFRYSDHTFIHENQILRADSSKTYEAMIKYRDDIDASFLPATDQTFTLSFTATYKQLPVSHITGTKYTVNINSPGFSNYTNEMSVFVNQTISPTITLYETAEEAMAEFNNNPFCLKHVLDDGVVTDSYVVFIITPEMVNNNPGITAGTYSLKGGGAVFTAQEYVSASPYYSTNKATMLSAFGSSKCNETIDVSNGSEYQCHISELTVSASEEGIVFARKNQRECTIYSYAESRCGSINSWM